MNAMRLKISDKLNMFDMFELKGECEEWVV